MQRIFNLLPRAALALTLLAAASLSAAAPPRAQGAGSSPRQGAPFSMDFPRLGMWWPDTWSQPAGQIARYDWVIYSEWDEPAALQAIHDLNPAQVMLTSTNACEVSFDPDASPEENGDVARMPAEWFLTQAGTTLGAAVNATTRTLKVERLSISSGGKTIPLFIPGDTAVLDGESVYIEAVNPAARTLTVRRGYVRPAATHPAGTRIAAHITFWPGSWLMNLSALAPAAVLDEAAGPERWGDYNARQAAALVNDPDWAWDGLLIDRSDGDESWLIGNSTARSIDPDLSNTLPESYAPFDAAWNAGLRAYEQQVRALIGEEKIIFTNWGYPNYDLLNGNNFEAFPLEDGSSYSHPWQQTVFGSPQNGSYFQWMQNSRQPNLTMIETYEDDGGPEPSGSGEYYNPCARPGFTPDYRKMRFGLGTALLNDGFFSYEINTNGHGSLCLLWFDEYDNAGAGRGYLGQPLGPARQALGALTTPNRVQGGGLDSQGDLDLWSLWADEGCAASLSLDEAQKAAGSAAARVDVTQACSEDWQVSFSPPALPLQNGRDYTLTFQARADHPITISAWAQQNQPPWDIRVDFGSFELGEDWRTFEVSGVSGGTDAAAGLNFNLGLEEGSVWIDAVALQEGSRAVWRRDFTGGSVLVNASGSPAGVDLEAWYRHLDGAQDPAVNSGLLTRRPVVNPRDALILLPFTPGVPSRRAFFPLAKP